MKHHDFNKNDILLPSDQSVLAHGLQNKVGFDSRLQPYEGASRFDEDGGFNFWEILQILLRRKWLILAITLMGIGIAIVLTLRATPM